MLWSLPRTHSKILLLDRLHSAVTKVSAAEILVICGTFNGQLRKLANTYKVIHVIHGGHGYGLRNTEGECILEFAVARNLIVGNSLFN